MYGINYFYDGIALTMRKLICMQTFLNSVNTPTENFIIALMTADCTLYIAG